MSCLIRLFFAFEKVSRPCLIILFSLSSCEGMTLSFKVNIFAALKSRLEDFYPSILLILPSSCMVLMAVMNSSAPSGYPTDCMLMPCLKLISTYGSF